MLSRSCGSLIVIILWKYQAREYTKSLLQVTFLLVMALALKYMKMVSKWKLTEITMARATKGEQNSMPAVTKSKKNRRLISRLIRQYVVLYG